MITKEQFLQRIRSRYVESDDSIPWIVQYDKVLTFQVKQKVYDITDSQLKNYFLCMDYCLEYYLTVIPEDVIATQNVVNLSNKKEVIVLGKKKLIATLKQLLALVRLVPYLDSLSNSDKVNLIIKNCDIYRPKLWQLLEEYSD